MNLPTSSPSSSSRVFLRLLPTLFFFSGASSLIFETIFTRLLTYAFGNTAYAVSTVLAAFLGGLALGAFFLGRWIDRRGASLRVYGVLELLVGIYCLFTPQLFAAVTRLYVALCHALNLAGWELTAARFAISGAVILVPTVLMGGTLPVLARCAAAAAPEFQPEVDRLYAWNTLGAALGTLASTYFLMPTLGVRGTVNSACAANLAIFLTAMAWSGWRPLPSVGQGTAPAPPAEPPLEPASTGARAILMAGAFLTGAVALAYEVVWTHILSFLIGNTVYAFGIMLFAFLCGLGWGAHLVATRLARAETWPWALAASQLLLALAVFLTLPVWNHIPDVFAQGLARARDFDVFGLSFLILLRAVSVAWRLYRRSLSAAFPWGRAAELVVEVGLLGALLSGKAAFVWNSESGLFVAGELLRFFCAFYLLILPCLLLGLSFPLLLNLATRASRSVGASVGQVYAANTLGTVLGSVLTGFVVIPLLGSVATLRAAATANLLLGLGFAYFLVPLPRPRRVALAVAAAAMAALLWAGPGRWDARQMSRGTYVYFTPGWAIDRVLYAREDVQGGLTAVVEVAGTHLLLSNGKFQGNDSGELPDQARFAMIPVLFTHGFDRALVIGLGTGHTLRVVARFPFRKIDAVEIAPHMVDAARQWFSDINGDVFDRDPRVQLTVADGRNFLLLSRDRYDLMTMEITSIWISGEADLYNREFYQLCRARLTERGVLQQWVQLHHLRTEDLLVVLNTAARVFPHVAFFRGPEQGLLVASAAPLACDFRRIQSLEEDPGVRAELETLHLPSFWSLLGEMTLYDDSLRNAVAQLPRLSALPPDSVSSDDHPYLEYQTPKGNALQVDSARANAEFLSRFTPPDLAAAAPLENLDAPEDKNLVLGYIAEARGDVAAALDNFRRVEGPGKPRAQAEIARLAGALRNTSPR